MSTIFWVLNVVSNFAALIAVVGLYIICKGQSKRIKDLEHFIYPEWEEERREKLARFKDVVQ